MESSLLTRKAGEEPGGIVLFRVEKGREEERRKRKGSCAEDGGEGEEESRGAKECAKNQTRAGRHHTEALGAADEAGEGVDGRRRRGGLPRVVHGGHSEEVRTLATKTLRFAGEAYVR
jgi:hypothetical protein